ncbi:MAG: histidinol-phosphate transaminase [Rhodobacteraceae bacterium]|nr:histidinol-phosphate transaminase [Paracoccaceae bacterium]
MTPGVKPALAHVSPYRQGKATITRIGRVIKLSSNESPYPPSPTAVAAFHRTEPELGRYPDGSQAGIRQALATVHGIPARNIFAGNGSEEAIGLVIRSMMSTGDEMVTSRNSFIMADIHARSVGAEIVRCDETRHRVDVGEILSAVTDRTRIVYVCSPNNPTGTYTTACELRRLDAELPAGVLLIVDAAYGEFVDAGDYDTGQALFSPGGRIVVTRTFSKAYALASLRIGWALAPDGVIDSVNRLRTPFNTNQAALNAAVAAVQDQEYLERVVERVRRTREHFIASLRELGLSVVSSQANFVLLTFPGGGNQAEDLDAALQASGILGRPAAAGANEFRISIGTEEEMSLALAAIRDWVNSRREPC